MFFGFISFLFPLAPSLPSHVYQQVVEGDLSHQLMGNVLQGPGYAVLSEKAFEREERGLHHPSSAVAFEQQLVRYPVTS